MSVILLLGGQPAAPASTGYMPQLIVELDRDDLIEFGFILDHPTKSLLDSGNTLDRATSITWDEDISQYVRSGSINRGAQRELQRTEAADGTLVLDNRDGRFTPFNTASPYSPDIIPMRRIRIQAVWAEATYPVFTGFVESWPVTFPEDVDNIVTIRITDAFKLLANVVVSGGFPEQTTGARIQAVLLAAGFLPPEMDIDLGVSTAPAATLVNANALQHIQEMEVVEGGRFFVSRIGQLVFTDRQQSSQPDLSTRTWSDDGTGMSYRDIRIVFDDELILNDVRLTREGGEEQVATDGVSQQHYGVRSLAQQNVPLSTDGQVADLAQRYIDRYSAATQRIEGLEDNAMRHLMWDQVLSREMTDIVKVQESVTDTAQVSSIEGIAHEFTQDTWAVSLRVAPRTVENYARLDDPAFRLDDNFILGR